MTEFAENRLQEISTYLNCIDDALTRIADALDRAYPKSMQFDGQVARKAEPDVDEKEVSEADIKHRFEMMMKVCRPIAKDAAQKALVDAGKGHPGLKIAQWPAKARADLLKKLRALDPLDDEVPF